MTYVPPEVYEASLDTMSEADLKAVMSAEYIHEGEIAYIECETLA